MNTITKTLEIIFAIFCAILVCIGVVAAGYVMLFAALIGCCAKLTYTVVMYAIGSVVEKFNYGE